MIKIKLAGLRIQIENRFSAVERLCREYMSDFDGCPDISVKITDEEIAQNRTVFSREFDDGYLESVCIYRAICKKLPLFDRLMLHSSIVKSGNKAIAFCGKSGVGKTTHTKLLLKNYPELKVINGDKPILHIKDNEILALPSPWAGDDGLKSLEQAPLDTLCFLEQAKENRLVTLEKNEALSLLLGQFIVPTEPLVAAKHLELVDRLLDSCKLYKLYCTEDDSAAMLSYKKLIKGETL